MYARSLMGRTLTFAFPWGLLKDNLLLYDKETGSLWSQMQSKAVSGPLEGTPMETFPAMQTSWGHWKRLHPDTDAMVLPGTEGHPYIYRALRPGERPATPLIQHDLTELGIGISRDGESRFYPLLELRKAGGPVEDSLAGQPLLVHLDAQAPTAWITDRDGRLLPAIIAYRWAWTGFHPNTGFFTAHP